MENTITVPPPEEIRRRIQSRRAEISELEKLLKLSAAAERARELGQQHTRQEVSVAR
jgi:hypothetical protein